MVTRRQADVATLQRALDVLERHQETVALAALKRAIQHVGGKVLEPRGEIGALEVSPDVHTAIARAIRRQWPGVTDSVVDAVIEDVNQQLNRGTVWGGQAKPSTIDDPARTALVQWVQRVFERGPVVMDAGTARIYSENVMRVIDTVYGEPPEGSELGDQAAALEVERLAGILRRVKGMAKAGEWIDGDSLNRYIEYHLGGVPEVVTQAKEPF